jgi:hypothetical protein
VPVGEPSADKAVFSADLENGLQLTREFAAVGGISITSTVTNASDKPQGVLLHACLNLDLGPGDATVLAARGNPVVLAVPSTQMTYTYGVPAELLGSPLVLANGETGLRAELRFALGSATSAAVITTSAGSVPLRIDLYSQLPGLPPGGSAKVVHMLAVGHSEVPGAEKPREHHADTIEIQDDRFGLYKEGQLSEFAMDETASDGWAARQLGSDKEWSIQWPIDASLFEPGAKYRLSLVARIDKKSDAGSALSFGVYDTINAVGVLGGSRTVAEMADGWQTIEMGEFVPTKGLYVWTAPPTNGDNVAWVYVDKLIFEKVNE